MTATYTEREIDLFINGMQHAGKVGLKTGRGTSAWEAIQHEISDLRKHRMSCTLRGDFDVSPRRESPHMGGRQRGRSLVIQLSIVAAFLFFAFVFWPMVFNAMARQEQINQEQVWHRSAE